MKIQKLDLGKSLSRYEIGEKINELIDSHNKEEDNAKYLCEECGVELAVNSQPKKCDHEWEFIVGSHSNSNPVYCYNGYRCKKCGKTRFDKKESQPKKWKPEEMILRLQHILTKLGYGCKCSNFRTNPFCPIHYTEGISKSEDEILKNIININRQETRDKINVYLKVR